MKHAYREQLSLIVFIFSNLSWIYIVVLQLRNGACNLKSYLLLELFVAICQLFKAELHLCHFIVLFVKDIGVQKSSVWTKSLHDTNSGEQYESKETLTTECFQYLFMLLN